MKKCVLIGLCLGTLVVAPGLASADCADFGGFTSLSVTGNTVTLYARNTPFVRFDVQSCSVQGTSKIELIKSQVCDGDQVIIDGSRCTVMNVQSSL